MSARWHKEGGVVVRKRKSLTAIREPLGYNAGASMSRTVVKSEESLGDVNGGRDRWSARDKWGGNGC